MSDIWDTRWSSRLLPVALQEGGWWWPGRAASQAQAQPLWHPLRPLMTECWGAAQVMAGYAFPADRSAASGCLGLIYATAQADLGGDAGP